MWFFKNIEACPLKPTPISAIPPLTCLGKHDSNSFATCAYLIAVGLTKPNSLWKYLNGLPTLSKSNILPISIESDLHLILMFSKHDLPSVGEAYSSISL